MLADMQLAYKNIPLPISVLDTCLGILKILPRLTDKPPSLPLIPVETGTGNSPNEDSSENITASPTSKVNESNSDVDIEVKVEADVDAAPPSPLESNSDVDIINDLSAFWPIFVPDQSGTLAPSTSLSFNDAPWIPPQAMSQLHQQGGGLRFVHRNIGAVDAKLFGCQSLRDQLFSGDQMICPAPQYLRNLISGDSLLEALGSLISMADTYGASSLHILYDGRHHPTASLMHPGMGSLCGPSLVMYLEGVILGTEGITQAFTCPVRVPSVTDTTTTTIASSLDISTSSSSSCCYDNAGKRMSAAFALTDCVQILSGRFFYVLDPCGTHLTASLGEEGDISNIDTTRTTTRPTTTRTANSSNNNNPNINNKTPQYPPRGQKCSIIGGVEALFPDQFAPLLSLPLGGGIQQTLTNRGEIPGTLFRLALRQAPSPISDDVVSEEDVRTALRMLKGNLEGALLFGRGVLQRVTVSHWLQGDAGSVAATTTTTTDGCKTDLDLVAVESPPARTARRKARLQDSGWKKTGVMAMFKAFVPIESCHNCKINTYLGLSDGEKEDASDGNSGNGGGWLRWTPRDFPVMDSDGRRDAVRGSDEWLVLTVTGGSVSRSLALQEPFKSLQIPPVVQLAARISQLHQHRGNNNNNNNLNDNSPVSGFVFCGSGSLGTVGLPFHIEGPFIQDLGSRDLCLPLSPSERRATVEMNTNTSSSSSQITRSQSTPPSLPVPIHQLTAWNAALLSDALETLLPKLLTEVKDLVMRGAGDRSRLYQYWPYLPRMSLRGAHVARTCKMLVVLSSMPLYLRRGAFVTPTDCLLTTATVPSKVLQYLQDLLPIAVTPAQVGKDLLSHPNGQSLGVRTLSPAVLRETLRRNITGHCEKLRGKPELLIPMLRFCISDAPRPEETSEHRRRYFRDLAGCPLLPTADGVVRPFSLHSRDRVAIASPALHVLLPQLASSFFDPKYLSGLISIIKDTDFRQELFVDKFSTVYLQERASQVFPPNLRGLRAVLWGGADDNGTHPLNVPRVTNTATSLPEAIVPSTVLVFVLWRDVLAVTVDVTANKEDDHDHGTEEERQAARLQLRDRQEGQLMLLGDWPLLPVVSLGRKLLMPPTYLNHVLAHEYEPDSNSCVGGGPSRSSCVKLTRQLETLMSSVNSSATAGDNLNSPEADKSWQWTSQMSKECALLASKIATVIPRLVSQIVEDNNTPPPPPPSASIPRPSVPSSLSTEDREIRDILLRLGVPVIDRDFFPSHPSPVPSLVLHGQRLLTCLRKIHNGSGGGVTIHRPWDAPYETARDDGSGNGGMLLSFDDLSAHERNMILLDVARDPTHQPSQLRSLPLFTSTSGRAVTADAPGGTYWCSADEDIEEVIAAVHAVDNKVNHNNDNNNVNGNNNESSSGPRTVPVPVMLLDDPSLREVVYPVVGVSQLTYLECIRRFALPALTSNRLGYEEKMNILRLVRKHWGSCRDSREVVDTLKAFPFLPPWIEKDKDDSNGNGNEYDNESKADGQTASGDVDAADVDNDNRGVGGGVAEGIGSLSRAGEVLSWKNKALLQALRCTARTRSCNRYFPPLSFRDDDWHSFLKDLGMQDDLDKDSLLRVSSDIEAVMANQLQHQQSTEESEIARSEAICRARGLLGYLHGEEGRSAAISALSDQTTARKISKLKFVPVQIPIRMDEGGVLVTKSDLTSFDRLLSDSARPLGFTVMAVLDPELEPPQVYFSALGITTAPSLEVALKNLRNIMSAAPLDRWSGAGAKCPLQQTFTAILSMLQDRWREISPVVQQALKGSGIVPVGHNLVKPGHLFFRLSEDLSPFMHEVPRCFGPYEIILKQLGVRESPSRADYRMFLQELKRESQDQSLNPNELRAVLTIVQLYIFLSVTWSLSLPMFYGCICDMINHKLGGLSAMSLSLSLSQHQHQSEGKDGTKDNSRHTNTNTSDVLYVPDDQSVLRDPMDCLVNDDDWLRDQGADCLSDIGMYFIHTALTVSGGTGTATTGSSGVSVAAILVDTHDNEEHYNTTATASSASYDSNPKHSNENEDGYYNRHNNNNNTKRNDYKNNDQTFQCSLFIFAVIALLSKVTAVANEKWNSSREKDTATGSGGDCGASASLHSRVQQCLETVTIRFVPELFTQLIMDDPRRRRTTTLSSKHNACLSFAMTSNNNNNSNINSSNSSIVSFTLTGDNPIILINRSMLRPPLTVSLAVARGLATLLRLPMPVAPSLVLLLDARPAVNMELLHSLHIGGVRSSGGNGDGDEEGEGGVSIRYHDAMRGVPGRPLTAGDKRLLELKPFRSFRPGEIIAIDTGTSTTAVDTTVDTAGVVEGISNDSNSNSHGNGNEYRFGEMIYGVVMHCSEEGETGEESGGGGGGAGLRRVSVMQGGERVVRMLSSDIYSFRSGRELVPRSQTQSQSPSTGRNTIASASVSALASRLGVVATDNIRTMTRTMTASTSDSIPTVSVSQHTMTSDDTTVPGLGLGLGPVSREEVLMALRGLQTRAGIPIDTNTEHLCGRIMELGESLSVVEKQLVAERHHLSELQEASSRSVAAQRCEICLTSLRSHVMVPCGHTLCASCLQQLPRNICPFCRTNIQQQIRFFIPGMDST
eukprot:gene5114-10234_t